MVVIFIKLFYKVLNDGNNPYKLLCIKLKIEYPFGIVINTVIVTAGNFEP